MLRRLIFYAITIAIPILFAYVLFEYGFARFFYSNTASVADKSFDPIMGWRLSEGEHWIKPPHSFGKHTTSINRLGLRNPPIDDLHNPGTTRIIVLGDSFTFGQAVPQERLFTSVLERNLNHSPSVRFEVINAGVPGYGSAQELLLLRSLAQQNVVADLYVLMLFTNDILDNLRLGYSNLRINPVQPGFELDSSARLHLVHKPERVGQYRVDGNFRSVEDDTSGSKALEVVARNIESFLQTKPKLIAWMNENGFDIDVPRMPGLLNGWYRPSVRDSGVPLLRELIREISREAHSQNARLIASLIPSPMQIYADTYGVLLENSFPNRPEIQRWLADPRLPQQVTAEICTELGIPFLDLYPLLVANNHREFYIPREGHFNEAGHEFVAQALTQFVSENH